MTRHIAAAVLWALAWGCAGIAAGSILPAVFDKRPVTGAELATGITGAAAAALLGWAGAVAW